MKKIYITIFFCLQLSLVVAQDNSSIQQTEQDPNWPVLLSNLDTTQITSGILIDKITTFANLINYNTTEKNSSNSQHFNQALSELFRASDQTRLISLSELTNRTANTTSENTVDVGIINTTFHKLNFNEENPDAGGLIFDQGTGKLSSIAGQQSYIGKKITVISPLKEFISGSGFQFNFKSTLILNNETTTIKTLVVDFEDGNAAATIISNSAIVIPNQFVNYSTSGMKTLTFTITFSDNTTLITYGKIYVNYNSNAQRLSASSTNSACYELLKDKGVFTSTIPFQGYAETSAVYGKTEYTIFYGNNNNAKQMVKPIIIVDGFDPKDKRKVQDCDCEQDPTCVLNNDDDDNGVFNPAKHESLEDLMNYNVMDPVSGLPQVKNLIVELRSKGYDVIIINNPTYTTTNVAGQSVTIDGGADYIERNAMTLVSYMQSVKGQQAIAGSTQNLVLLGPSMGGQITRYALAYMEKKFVETNDPIWQHNARLWISVDSPHLGANIPVGAQANIWFLADKLGQEPAKIQYYEELNSVAGKQQIISQFKNAKETGYLGGNSFFTTYYNNLNTNGVAGSGGYPVSNSNFRKIAMANGSLTGKTEATEQQTFLYMRGYIRGLWPFQSSTITLLRLQDNFMPAYGQTSTVFKGDGQNSTFNIGFNHWYIDFSHPRYTLNVNNNNSIKGSMDIVPGGYFKTAKLIQEAVSDGLSESGVRQETRDYIETHSFISTFSALGHLNPNQNWGNPLNTNLICQSNKQTPFDSYYGTENNTEHTSFTKESIDWLFKELEGNPQAPVFPLQAGLLSGTDKICVDQTSTYSFADICKIPGAVSWSVSSNLQIMSSTTTSVIIKGLANGQGIVTATFQNGMTVTKNVWVGASAFSITRGIAESETCDIKYHYVPFIINLPPGTSLNFNYLYPNVRYSQNGNTYTFQFLKNYSGPFSIIATATNSCGSYTVDYEEGFFINNCSWVGSSNSNSNTTSYYKVYPNPSTDVVNVSLVDESQKPENTTKIVAELYDFTGQPKQKVEVKNNIASINCSGLPKGIYILKIKIDGEEESHQVFVQ